MTLSVMSTVWSNSSPPCTVRWPTALMSAIFGPWASNIDVIAARASSWSAKSWVTVNSSPPTVCSSVLPVPPIFWMRPVAMTRSSAMSMTWYLIEDDPAFNRRMSMLMGGS